MMMTCRLLCALLVLALCCCPSVCTSESPKMDDASSATTNTITQTPTTNKPGGADGSVNSHSTSSDSGLQENDQSGSSDLGPVADNGTKAGADPGAATLEKQSNGPNNVVHTEVKRSTTESQSGTSVSLENEDNEAEDAPTTTTTSTKVPIKSTTAPEAPSTTTTTQAPTTTTTRAPSRLREIDGSLSSSAWVCATLLLAVSALAYTTLG
ncbi:putative mucin TcMUCII [Trypanosoma cruzi]|uniref:Mucin TcMUCII, putative n=2 Tax=Trypanosoma cruzi TaxID=5693 RepID=Q4E1A2_TRYCC|nr:mucin TcMUCII, putative [Trypanosoma cruzi]EAN98564.1 mucin TcMUCII, putative [Trypanosoma cruzi]PWV17810.1 putative mucin TcMUCII [Trypanosoma cruzi]|eukprot:XP_820415.1 mucin TcMUCII [Trypanosoma cruzi strain CL Brener]